MDNGTSTDVTFVGANTGAYLISCRNPFGELLSRVETSRFDVLRLDPNAWLDNGKKDTMLKDHCIDELDNIEKKSQQHWNAFECSKAWLSMGSARDEFTARIESFTASRQVSEPLNKSIQDWSLGPRMDKNELDALETLVSNSIDVSENGGRKLKTDVMREFTQSRQRIVEYRSLKKAMDDLTKVLDP